MFDLILEEVFPAPERGSPLRTILEPFRSWQDKALPLATFPPFLGSGLSEVKPLTLFFT